MEDCIFCKIVAGSAPSYKINESDEVVAFLAIPPAVEGHTLVIPKAHYENIFDIPADLMGKIATTAKAISVRYKEKMELDGVNIMASSGKAAHQEIMHFHVHIIPRKSNDGYELKIYSSSNHSEEAKDLKAVWERLKE